MVTSVPELLCREARPEDLEGVAAVCKQAAEYAPHHSINLDPERKWWWEAEDLERLFKRWRERRYVGVAVLDGRVLAFQNCNPRPEVVKAKGLKKIEIEQIWVDQTLDPDLIESARLSLVRIHTAQLYLDAGTITAEMVYPVEVHNRPSVGSASRPTAEREAGLALREGDARLANALDNYHVEPEGTVPVSEASQEQKLGFRKVTFTICQEEIDKAKRLLGPEVRR